VKYRWRTLQLLPDRARPSYAGSVVEVLEGLDGRLAVQHEGRIVASQEAPPRPSILRSFDTRTVHTTVPSRHTNGVIRRSEDEVTSMGTMLVVDRLRDDADRNGAARVRRTATPRSRKPTPLQTARWKAVQKAKRKGLSIRGIARELGIHRETVRKYMHAESPPMARPRNVGSTVIS
jgi:DNA-binding NarL/FixJ family response regulator